MRYLSKVIFSLSLIVLCPAVHADYHPAQTEQRFIVKLKDNVHKEAIEKEGIYGREVKILCEYDSINALLVEFVDDLEVDTDQDDENIDVIEQDQVKQWIDPITSDDLETDEIAYGATIPFGLNRIGANAIPSSNRQKIHATVAIIDSGIDAKHPNLHVVKEINFVNPYEPQRDENGHGTHVAGTVGAKNQGFGVIGVAPGVNLIALKVLDEDGSGSNGAIIKAIDWVTKHADEVDVVNMSLGGQRGYGYDLMHEAIKKSVEKGVVYVVAAGNEDTQVYYSEGHSRNSVPAAYPEVMTVSATVDTDGVPGGFGPRSNCGFDDTIATFSNYSNIYTVYPNAVHSPGGCIDVAAPGVDILSTYPGKRYKKFSGTSMASPHVAGIVARYIAKNRNQLFPNGIKNRETVYKIRQILIDCAEPQHEWNANFEPSRSDRSKEGLIQLVE